MRKIKNLFKKKLFWFFVALAVVLFFVFSTGPKTSSIEFSSTKVEKIDLIQSVSETGSVVADLEILYGWEVSGKVVEILKEVGEEIKKDEVIARLSSTKQKARLNEAYSLLSAAKAKLNLEIVGPSDGEKNKSLATINQAKAAVDQFKATLEKTKATAESDINDAKKVLEDAENDLQLAEGGEDSQLVQDAYSDLVNVLKSALTNISNALTEVDNILGVDNIYANEDFEGVLGLGDLLTLPVAKNSYSIARNAKKDLQSDVISLSSSDEHSFIDSISEEVDTVISLTQKSLYDTQSVLSATSPIASLTQAELDVLKTGVSTEQAAVNTSATDLTNSVQAVSTARNSLSSYQIAYDKAVLDLENTKKKSAADIDIAEAQLNAKKASLQEAEASHDVLVSDPRDVDLASLQAEVNRQAANAQALQDDVNKTELIALADGVLAKLDIDVGENVSANQEVITLTSSEYNIEVDISESDVAKVSIGDEVMVTLDAFGDDVHFEGSVVSIEPEETEISGVVYYKTNILLGEYPDYPIKSGMTANVNIETDKRADVVVVPRRAVISQDDKKIVRVLTDLETAFFEEREVTTGLEGDDGLVEVLSGLEEGEEIITFLKEE